MSQEHNIVERKKVKNVFEEFNIGLLIYVFNKSILWVFLFIFMSYAFARVYLRFANEIYKSSAKVMLKKQKEIDKNK